MGLGWNQYFRNRSFEYIWGLMVIWKRFQSVSIRTYELGRKKRKAQETVVKQKI